MEDLADRLLALLPTDGSSIGNGALRQALSAALGRPVDEAEYLAAQRALVDAGRLVKGRGRGGSVARAPDASATPAALSLTAQERPADADKPKPKQAAMSLLDARRAKAAPKAARVADAAATVLAYRHDQKRVNNPEVGMVTPDTDGEERARRWAYDPHIDPALAFDVGRAGIERLIDDALASGDAETMREALATLKRMAEPYLNWAGKAERTSFEIDTVSLHVHERVDPAAILGVMKKRMQQTPAMSQGDFFRAWFEHPLPYREAIEFYRHERGWANRLISGDSLLVMNSLLQKEGMAGQVQMIYIDPPYGIKYGSNFQPFVGRRDVKDRKDEDLTAEPEMIKAFRDTWELGIHSYLTYLRDRLLLARELVSESGSVFVQISDENLHHVRELLDELLGCENFISIITTKKTGGMGEAFVDNVSDYVVWYGKRKERTKFNPLFLTKAIGVGGGARYNQLQLTSGYIRSMTAAEKQDPLSIPYGARPFLGGPMTSETASESTTFRFLLQGRELVAAKGGWKTGSAGMQRLIRSSRLRLTKEFVNYKMFVDDFPAFVLTNLWADTMGTAEQDKSYVVQTTTKVVERCMLMTTDPGDLVLDPTCGSGTTAYVAEKWGRRWITCDTSRVAITLAKQRLMTASYDYYTLKYPHEGLRGGFIYKSVPHVTLKSIANNPEIDQIWAAHQPEVEAALAGLNIGLKLIDAPPWTVTEGGWKGREVDFAASRQTRTLPSGEVVSADMLLEWEVPFDLPAAWERVADAFAAFHACRMARQKAMDDSIAAHADQEQLFDQPQVDKQRLRITGPFTVEAVPFPSVKSLDASAPATEVDAGVAREGESSRQHQWRAELLKTGIRGKGGQMLRIADLEPLPELRHLHCTGSLAETGERVVVSFGPEHAALEQRQVELAMREAGELFPRPKMIVFCAFTFDPEAAKDIDATKGITALKVQMNTDLLTEDLKKARASNQSFWLMGQPDVELRRVDAKGKPLAPGQADKDGRGYWQVEVNGFDYFDTAKGELVSGGKGKIAAWSLDTDYDERSLFPRQVFFPMASAKDGWNKLRRDIKAELDERLLDHLHGTVSLPFEAGDHRKIAVKIVDDRGIESLKVISLDQP
jgi:adenine-specific DNA-methyltransferase